MKKFFTFIAAALCTLGASAELTTDVSAFTNYIYVKDAELVADGTDQTVTVALVQDGFAESLGLTVIFPEGYVVKKCVAIKGGYAVDEDGEAVIGKAGNTIKDNSVKTAFTKSTNPAEGTSCWNAPAVDILTITVTVPENAASTAEIKVFEGEVSLGHYHERDLGLPYNYEMHDVVTTLTVGSADAIDNVKADGTEAAEVAKKVVNGQLVIETANGTFSAAGAQVK